MTAKRLVPKKPEPFLITNEENDNIFYALLISEEFGEDTLAELALVVDVKGNGETDDVEYLYTVLNDAEQLTDLRSWIDKAVEYLRYVEIHGAPISLILDVQEDEELEDE